MSYKEKILQYLRKRHPDVYDKITLVDIQGVNNQEISENNTIINATFENYDESFLALVLGWLEEVEYFRGFDRGYDDGYDDGWDDGVDSVRPEHTTNY